MIGRGGFADVYKGSLQDGQLIVVKLWIEGLQKIEHQVLFELGLFLSSWDLSWVNHS